MLAAKIVEEEVVVEVPNAPMLGSSDIALLVIAVSAALIIYNVGSPVIVADVDSMSIAVPLASFLPLGRAHASVDRFVAVFSAQTVVDEQVVGLFTISDLLSVLVVASSASSSDTKAKATSNLVNPRRLVLLILGTF